MMHQDKSTYPTTPVKLGSFIWFVVLTLFWIFPLNITVLDVMFLLAPLVIIPLGLALIDPPQTPSFATALYKALQISQPVGATLAVLSFLLPQGWLAGGLAAGWLLICGLIGLLGVWRLLDRGFDLRLAEISIDAGLLFLPVGGGWLVMARSGINPLGFDDVIVLLTAVHFHYAAFAALIITGTVGRLFIAWEGMLPPIYRWAVIGVILGTPLVAAGITASPLLEVVGAVILATSLATIGYLIGLRLLPRIAPTLVRGLLSIAVTSLLIGMTLIYVYAIGEFTHIRWISIPQMIRFHGMANALGFALCGLAAFNNLLAHPPKKDKSRNIA